MSEENNENDLINNFLSKTDINSDNKVNTDDKDDNNKKDQAEEFANLMGGMFDNMNADKNKQTNNLNTNVLGVPQENHVNNSSVNNMMGGMNPNMMGDMNPNMMGGFDPNMMMNMMGNMQNMGMDPNNMMNEGYLNMMNEFMQNEDFMNQIQNMAKSNEFQNMVMGMSDKLMKKEYLYDQVKMMQEKQTEFYEKFKDKYSNEDKTVIENHIKVFKEIYDIYQTDEGDNSKEVMSKMFTLYEHGQPPKEFIEYIEPELKKLEEDPNNPMYKMFKEFVPNDNNNNNNVNNVNPNQNNEDMPNDCKNN